MRFSHFIWLFVLTGTFSCVKTIDLAPPAFVQEPVLSGLLHPDNLIRVQLSYSFPANAVNPSPTRIQNARVTMSEDGLLLTPLAELKPGLYGLNQKPKAGKVYSITATLSNGVKLTAQDRVPVRPTLTARLTGSNPDNSNSNPDIILKLSPFESASAIQWLSMYMRERTGRDQFFETTTQGIQSNSLLLDEFNSSLSGKNFKRAYWPYARIKPVPAETLENLTITFNTGNSVARVDKPDEFYQLTIWTGSPAFDQYLRSTLVAYQNQVSGDGGISENPFAQPSPIWSNITNGKGIFAGYSTQVIVLKEGGK
ncbi:MAG: DUF4249 domain-containing protein [Rudanella sp.]|nr:DUF4249 domain-containing protein [Rudanella sp.]